MFDERFQVFRADVPQGAALYVEIRRRAGNRALGFVGGGVSPRTGGAGQAGLRSAAFVVRDRSTQGWVAATRLLLPRSGVTTAVAARSGGLDPAPTVPANGEILPLFMIGPPSHGGVAATPSGTIGWVRPEDRLAVTLGMLRAVFVSALKARTESCLMRVSARYAEVLQHLGAKMALQPAVGARTDRPPAYLIELRRSILSMSNRSTPLRQMFRNSHRAYGRLSIVLADLGGALLEDRPLSEEIVVGESVLLPEVAADTAPAAPRRGP